MVGSSCVDNTLGIRLPLELIDDLKWLNRAEETRLEDPFEIVPIERNWNGDSWDLQFTAFERLVEQLLAFLQFSYNDI